MNKPLLSIELESFKAYQTSLNEAKEKCSVSEAELKAMDLSKTLSSIDSIYTESEGIARIDIVGLLKPKLDFFDVYFGLESTSYDQIIRALEKANNDESIKEIEIYFNTPGGYINGMASVADYMKNIDKPINGFVCDLCASAGYFLASQCDSIACLNEMSTLGSIGVMVTTTTYSDDDYIEFRSKNAPFKALGADTEEGKKIIQESIDAKEEIFINYIGEGRGVEVSFIKENFGRGKTMLASEAINAKMADTILNASSATPSEKGARTNNNNQSTKDSTMDAKEIEKAVADALTIGLAPVMTQLGAVKTDLEETKAQSKKDKEELLAQSKRTSEFASLKEKYPEQKAIIDEAFNSDKACDIELMGKVSDAEIARVQAKAEAGKNGKEGEEGDGANGGADGADKLQKAKDEFNRRAKAMNPQIKEL